jgi:integrase
VLACSKRHGSWTFRVDVPAAGDGQRRRQVTRGGFPTRAAAEQALHDVLEPDGASVLVVDRRLPLGEYLDRLLSACTLILERPAWTNYERVLALYVRPHLDRVLLHQLEPAALSALYVTLAARGGQHGQPLSTTTVRLVHRVLHKALADAVIEGVLSVNRADRVRPPRRRTAETPIWTAPQIRTFLTSTQRDPLFPAWLLALTCGLRRGELAGLRWQDVDLEAATLTIANQRTTDASTEVVVKAPKGTSRRTLDLAPGAVAALRAHRAQQDADLPALRVCREPETLLFLREDGSPHLPARLTELFQAATRRARLPVIRLHDARHSCATLALSAGIHPQGRAAVARARLLVDDDGPVHPPRRTPAARRHRAHRGARPARRRRVACRPGPEPVPAQPGPARTDVAVLNPEPGGGGQRAFRSRRDKCVPPRSCCRVDASSGVMTLGHRAAFERGVRIS